MVCWLRAAWDLCAVCRRPLGSLAAHRDAVPLNKGLRWNNGFLVAVNSSMYPSNSLQCAAGLLLLVLLLLLLQGQASAGLLQDD
jgi:hypothetical protein